MQGAKQKLCQAAVHTNAGSAPAILIIEITLMPSSCPNAWAASAIFAAENQTRALSNPFSLFELTGKRVLSARGFAFLAMSSVEVEHSGTATLYCPILPDGKPKFAISY